MTTLVAGASGATGRLLVRQLLDRDQHVKAVVRAADRLPAPLAAHERVTVIEAATLDLADAELAAHVADCDAVASCLGHNLSFRGVFGPPHRLVTESVRRLCRAVAANRPLQPVRFVLMNTSGNHDRDDAPISAAQRMVLGLLRALVPPHADNEQAAAYLRSLAGEDGVAVEWVAVRPDGLVDADTVTDYTLHPAPTRSAIFDAGKTSRINVADFMARLITDDDLWRQWRGRMPVIYDDDPS